MDFNDDEPLYSDAWRFKVMSDLWEKVRKGKRDAEFDELGLQLLLPKIKTTQSFCTRIALLDIVEEVIDTASP